MLPAGCFDLEVDAKMGISLPARSKDDGRGIGEHTSVLTGMASVMRYHLKTERQSPLPEETHNDDERNDTSELECMAQREFRFVVSMQWYSKFNKEEHKNTEFLLQPYPDLQIAYLKEEPSSQLKSSMVIVNLFPIQHAADPNSALNSPVTPFSEMGSLTIKTMLSFSTVANTSSMPTRTTTLKNVSKSGMFLPSLKKTQCRTKTLTASGTTRISINGLLPSLALVNSTEYIFSENIGILGDLAAGKEQTFGTLAARSMAWVGGKLHYGHPDFLNASYMMTCSGFRKHRKACTSTKISMWE